jgi:hypothetical protein
VPVVVATPTSPNLVYQVHQVSAVSKSLAVVHRLSEVAPHRVGFFEDPVATN